MRNVTDAFQNIYLPQTALVIYKNEADDDARSYVEAFDFDEHHKVINRRRFSIAETGRLAKGFNACNELRADYLISKGLLPTGVLYLQPAFNGFAIWYTQSKKVRLLFSKDLDIPDGEAYVPAMVWKASKTQLQLYALRTKRTPTLKTKLCYAPFFNVKADQSICMGTVDVDMDKVKCLEQFMHKWEDYFYNSYFTHAHSIDAPIKGNLLHLWQQQIQTQQPFPTHVLKQNSKTINDLIV